MRGPGFTPGNWTATERCGYHEILAPCSDSDWYGIRNMHAVAYCDTEIDDSEQVANAHLIAAAPDLYEALRHIEQALGSAANGTLENEAAKMARAALAKARGEA